MEKKLAIVGHATRGREVIRLLKMLGGNEGLSDIGLRLGGTEVCCVYHIGDGGSIIYSHHSVVNDDFIVFTLEEFQKKYPFEVGDAVIYTKFGDDCNDYPLIIKSMKWTGTTIEYGFDGYFTCLTKDLQMWKSKDNPTNVSKIKNVLAELFEHIKTTPKEELEREFEEIKEWSNVGPTVEEFRTFCESVNKKPKYPNDYAECCKVLRISPEFLIKYSVDGNDTEGDAPLIKKFIKLKRCRDAYWKIAGEQMGLGKSWKPDWNDQNINKYCLATHCNMIVKHTNQVNNRVFSFPTSEMRDAFYENFKDLIEQCKELL